MNCSDSYNLLCCIQFSHAEFEQIYLHYIHAATSASFCLWRVGLQRGSC